MLQSIGKVLALFGGGAILFYALGFTVVQTYIRQTGIEGMLWISKDFYTDAGVKFLFDMVAGSILTPQFFIPLLALLIYLLPSKKTINNYFKPAKKGSFREQGMKKTFSSIINLLKKGFSRKQNIKKAFLLLLLFLKEIFSKKQNRKNAIFLLLFFLSFCFAFSYREIIEKTNLIRVIESLNINPTKIEYYVQVLKTFTFFGLLTPMVIALSILLFSRASGLIKRASKNMSKSKIRGMVFYQILFLAYFGFLIIIPLTYGLNVYDLKIVPVQERLIITTSSSQKEQRNDDDSIWLLGQFGDQWLFIRKKQGEKCFVESYDKNKVYYVKLKIKESKFLRDYTEETIQYAEQIQDTTQEEINALLYKEPEK